MTSDERVSITCGNCKSELKVKQRLAGRDINCPKCGNAITVTSATLPPPEAKKSDIPPATERQKEFALTLGISFSPDINRRDISALIEKAIAKRDEERDTTIQDWSQREGEFWEEAKKSVLAEMGSDEVPVSKATPRQIIDALDERGIAAILIMVPWDDVTDFSNLQGLEVSLSYSDTMSKADYESLIFETARNIKLAANETNKGGVSADTPFELKGDVLGMTLQEFKAKHHRSVPSRFTFAPWCSDSQPGEDIPELMVEAFFSSAGLVNCRLDFPYEVEEGNAAPTVAGVPTERLLYQFVDERLWQITATFDPSVTTNVHDALVAKYGEPNARKGQICLWNNNVSAICLREGKKTKRESNPTMVLIYHHELQALADSRMPGPAVDDL